MRGTVNSSDYRNLIGYAVTTKTSVVLANKHITGPQVKEALVVIKHNLYVPAKSINKIFETSKESSIVWRIAKFSLFRWLTKVGSLKQLLQILPGFFG